MVRAGNAAKNMRRFLRWNAKKVLSSPRKFRYFIQNQFLGWQLCAIMKSTPAPILAVLGFSAISAGAAALLAPTDPIKGGLLSGGTFPVATPGTSAGQNQFPNGADPEPPEDMINGFMGGPNEKFLNFAELNTGVVVSPAAAGSQGPIATMTLW